MSIGYLWERSCLLLGRSVLGGTRRRGGVGAVSGWWLSGLQKPDLTPVENVCGKALRVER